MINSLLSFGAKSVNPEILEQTLSTRRAVADIIEKNCIAKIKEDTTYQSIVIAPRGSGKTHITKVLYHRFIQNKDIHDKTVIAYMSEDEVGIANFTDLMVSILRSFVRYNEPNSENIEQQIIKASIIPDDFSQQSKIKQILNDYASNKKIILLIENFDKILESLKRDGQGSLRDFIHQYNNICIIATSQNLISSLQDSAMPFYNFFNIQQLKKLNFEDTIEFLSSIARSEKNDVLSEDIKKTEFKGKLKAIFELTEGNHRLLVTFYSFLKAEFKSELSDVFIKVMNDLKPYYEQFINALPPLQQKIVKHLSLKRGASKGKDIAQSCFIKPNVFSKQVSLLFENGMIDKTKIGKDVYYELKEPLMRIIIEIGENANGIAKLFVDFLENYYERDVIQKEYLKYRYGARFQPDELKCKYEKEAELYELALTKLEERTINYGSYKLSKKENQKELIKSIEEINIYDFASKSLDEGYTLLKNGEYQKSINFLQTLIKSEPSDFNLHMLIGICYIKLKQYPNAIISFEKATKINKKSDDAYSQLASTHLLNLDINNAIKNINIAISINPLNPKTLGMQGVIFELNGDIDDAIITFKKIEEIDKSNIDNFEKIGSLYVKKQKYEEAINYYQKALDITPNNESTLYGITEAYLKNKDFGLTIDHAKKYININSDNPEVYSMLGIAYLNKKDINKSIQYLSKSLESDEDFTESLTPLGIALYQNKEYKKSLSALIKSNFSNPNNTQTLVMLSLVHDELNEKYEAIQYLNSASKLPTADYSIFHFLSHLYLDIDDIENAERAINKALKLNSNDLDLNYSLLGILIRKNDFNSIKKLKSLLTSTDDQPLISSLTEDIFHNLFKYGSEYFIDSFLKSLLLELKKNNKLEFFWQALPEAIFEVLINIENYGTERLDNIKKSLEENLKEHQQSIIPIKMFSAGIDHLKHNKANALLSLSKEERKLFKEAVLEKREN